MQTILRRLKKLIKTLLEAYRYPRCTVYGAPESLIRLAPKKYRASLQGYNSQGGQDQLILSHFYQEIVSGNIPPVFIDVGCNHPEVASNSLTFEKHHGFQCLAIDAMPTFAELWASRRPQAIYINSAVGSENGTVLFDIFRHPKDHVFSAIHDTGRKKSSEGNLITEVVKVRRLEEILNEYGITSIGILSIDVEGHEMQVLQGINFDKTKIEIILIENTNHEGTGSQAPRSFLEQKGYYFYARIWNLDDVFVSRRLARRMEVPPVESSQGITCQNTIQASKL